MGIVQLEIPGGDDIVTSVNYVVRSSKVQSDGAE